MEKISYILKESSNGITEHRLSSELLMHRQLLLFDTITADTLKTFVSELMYLQREDAPIDIYINSCGGEVNAGLAIYDLIQNCTCEINVYCIGLAASMAAVIFAGCPKGHRFIHKHSQVMIHEPLIQGGLGGSASSIKNTSDSILKTKKLLNEIISKHTGKSLKEIDKATNHDNFFSAKEAIDFGLCDEIIETIKY